MKDLYDELMWWKAQEDQAKARIAEIEDAIIKRLGDDKLEGAVTRHDSGFKVVVTYKLNRTLDYDAYEDLGLPESMQFVDLKPTINLARLRLVEEINPSLIQKCVTTRPGKTQIKITQEEIQ